MYSSMSEFTLHFPFAIIVVENRPSVVLLLRHWNRSVAAHRLYIVYVLLSFVVYPIYLSTLVCIHIHMHIALNATTDATYIDF